MNEAQKMLAGIGVVFVVLVSPFVLAQDARADSLQRIVNMANELKTKVDRITNAIKIYDQKMDRMEKVVVDNGNSIVTNSHQIDAVSNRLANFVDEQTYMNERLTNWMGVDKEDIGTLFDYYDSMSLETLDLRQGLTRTQNNVVELHDRVSRVENALQSNGTNDGEGDSNPTIKIVHLEDNASGHAKGWNPGSVTGVYILENQIKKKSVIQFTILYGNPNPCWVSGASLEHGFEIHCQKIIPEGAMLNYTITNP